MQGLTEATEHAQGVRKLNARTVTAQPVEETFKPDKDTIEAIEEEVLP